MKTGIVLALLILGASCENLYGSTKYSVATVTSKNWDSQVNAKRNIGQVVIVHFYRADDGRSRSFRDVFDEEAKKSKGIFNFVGIDCQENIAICNREDVRQFPAIKVYPPVPIPVLPADTDLDMKKIVGRASGFVTSKVVEITDDNVAQKMGENPAVPKVLLFTDKPTMPILFKALSLAFDKKLMLGIVRKENKDVFHKYNVQKTPLIMVVKTGEKKPIEYKGEINYADIFDFLNIYSEQYVVGGGSSFDNAGSKPWLSEAIPELTSKSAKDICLETNGALCVIIFNQEKPSKTALDTVKEVRRRYDNKIDRGLKYNFMWVNAGQQKEWARLFQVNELPTTIILNPGKRKRYLTIAGDLEFNRLNDQLEKITGGDARFEPLREELPSLA